MSDGWVQGEWELVELVSWDDPDATGWLRGSDVAVAPTTTGWAGTLRLPGLGATVIPLGTRSSREALIEVADFVAHGISNALAAATEVHPITPGFGEAELNTLRYLAMLDEKRIADTAYEERARSEETDSSEGLGHVNRRSL